MDDSPYQEELRAITGSLQMGAAYLHLWNHCSHQIAPYADITAVNLEDLGSSTGAAGREFDLIRFTVRFGQLPLETWSQRLFNTIEQDYLFSVDHRADIERFFRVLLERCPAASDTLR